MLLNRRRLLAVLLSTPALSWAQVDAVVVEGKAGLREGESVKAQPEPRATTANREGE